MKSRFKFSAGALVLVVAVFVVQLGFRGASASAPSAQDSIAHDLKPGGERFLPVQGRKGMVVSDDELASEWGSEILKRGGNAVDAAVATALVLAVTRPYYASLGGGGFIVYCPPKAQQTTSRCTTIDYRERAPMATHRDFYIRNGKADTSLSQNGPLASGVPGVPAGLLLAHRKYGKLPRATLFERAIQLAERGYRITGVGEAAAKNRLEYMNDAAKALFVCEGKACPVGHLLKQADLARVLKELAAKGEQGFYRGWVAQRIAEEIQTAGGVMTIEDLAQYSAVEREPVVGSYRGYELVSMPPTSSGGLHLVQILGYLERAARDGHLKDGVLAPLTIHAMTHAMSLAFADRAFYLGDPDHTVIPVRTLLSQAYLDQRWSTFVPDRAALPPSHGAAQEPEHTTHLSTLDSEGGGVALTTTVNDEFGSGFVPAGTGIVMNDQMDDFSLQPGVPNLFGLIGAEANAVGPGKRPLSSMSPTIVRDARGEVRLVVGAQGGPRIITSVMQTIFNRIEWGMPLSEAVHLARFHQQWRPETLSYERYGVPAPVLRELERLGYSLKAVDAVGRVAAIERFPAPGESRVYGVSDLRTEGYASAQ